jgi:hypothetical protein
MIQPIAVALARWRKAHAGHCSALISDAHGNSAPSAIADVQMKSLLGGGDSSLLAQIAL